jgi:hypothetical protein
MNLRETGWGGMDWINLAWDRHQWLALVYMLMKFKIQQNVWKFLAE